MKPFGHDLGRPYTVADAFAAMMNSHDAAAVESFLVEDYVNHNRYIDDGRAANQIFWTQWFEAFPDTTVTVDDVLVDGDRVAGRFTYRATFARSFLGIPPTGQTVTMHSIDIWRTKDGMAVEHWDELDMREFMAQLTAGQATSS